MNHSIYRKQSPYKSYDQYVFNCELNDDRATWGNEEFWLIGDPSKVNKVRLTVSSHMTTFERTTYCGTFRHDPMTCCEICPTCKHFILNPGQRALLDTVYKMGGRAGIGSLMDIWGCVNLALPEGV